MTVVRRRLDVELVRRGLAESRTNAARLIGEGRVRVAGMPATTSARRVEAGAPITVVTEGPRFVSRGGVKLARALDTFAVALDGRIALDAGASTGGFTDCLLQHGAARVHAVDVGRGQLAWSIRQDPRVVVYERTNVRTIDAGFLGEPVDVVVADLSFISLATVLPALTACANAGADIVPMVKPQFEVGRDQVGSGGVVSDPQLRATAVLAVAGRAEALGWQTVDVTASPLPGPSGNVEYFLRLRATTERALHGDELDAAVRRAVTEGPQ